jgi:hypothetical protein
MTAQEYTQLVNELTSRLPYRVGRWAPQIARATLQTHPPQVTPKQWAYMLGAIIDRESKGGDALSPPSSGGVGDGGHGRGLMQIDDRYHQFARTGAWADAAANILYGAALLRSLYGQTSGDVQRAVAAYNAKAALTAQVPDSVTTGRNYATDVLARASGWAPDGVFA